MFKKMTEYKIEYDNRYFCKYWVYVDDCIDMGCITLWGAKRRIKYLKGRKEPYRIKKIVHRE